MDGWDSPLPPFEIDSQPPRLSLFADSEALEHTLEYGKKRRRDTEGKTKVAILIPLGYEYPRSLKSSIESFHRQSKIERRAWLLPPLRALDNSEEQAQTEVITPTDASAANSVGPNLRTLKLARTKPRHSAPSASWNRERSYFPRSQTITGKGFFFLPIHIFLYCL